MPPLNWTEPCSIARTATTAGLAKGWVSQPNQRGTLDILSGCIITILLCSWSVLCLHIPEPEAGHWSFLRYKLRWQFFTIIFPEVIVSMAAEQWESANQNVTKFTQLGYPQWTMRHAFFADMGGFMLSSPDFPDFPIDGCQLAYLVEQKYIRLPEVDVRTIWDRNKADGFARLITSVQIAWFCIKCIARWIQRLTLSTLELTTFAFIIATLNTLFFWNHKPLDVTTPIVLQTETRITDILIKAGDVAREPYLRTPLDFLTSPPTSWKSYNRPIRRFGNTKTRPPAGLTYRESIYGILFEFVYFGIHLIGWRSVFPTMLERYLWRISSLVLLGLLCLYLFCIPLGVATARPFSKAILGKELSTPLEVAENLPKWAQRVIHIPIVGFYVLARLYILLEGLVSLRALPLDAYTDISWSNFLPHLR
ncbi:hypothetical protein AOQ84DRAFT_408530 [Glonium stellatum]|uniref:Uncharacterized protein n=1 Tax=Glonium stellatum TaxID=574774 RepID=A0A8E2EZH1_9PEZI|nr:hypothetical protein AOQ84DRAFT_408530 [Glonium stellatum]